MEMDLLTRADLEQFRVQLLADIKILFSEAPRANGKPWLKGSDVRKLLGISSGSLQNLRISGKLKSSKVGGIHYYRYTDIEKMMQSC
jgi:helix-turn-helix protein